MLCIRNPKRQYNSDTHHKGICASKRMPEIEHAMQESDDPPTQMTRPYSQTALCRTLYRTC